MGNDLVGVSEIASMLGVSRQRVDQLATSPDFPDPVAELGAGRIWTRAAVEAWMAGQDSRAPAAELEAGIASALSDSLRRVLVGAQEIARRLRHRWVGTEHLLLSLLSTDGLTDVVAAAAKLGMQKEAAEAAISKLVPAGADEVSGPIAFTPRSYASLTAAKDLAATEGHPAIEPRHLLLALGRESDGVAGKVMAELSGVQPDLIASALEVALKAEQRRAAVATAPGKSSCTFCRKSQSEVAKLIAGPGVFICDECVELCAEIIGDEAGDSPGAPPEVVSRLDAVSVEIAEIRKLLAGRV